MHTAMPSAVPAVLKVGDSVQLPTLVSGRIRRHLLAVVAGIMPAFALMAWSVPVPPMPLQRPQPRRR
jgi:hypothetical protein